MFFLFIFDLANPIRGEELGQGRLGKWILAEAVVAAVAGGGRMVPHSGLLKKDQTFP